MKTILILTATILVGCNSPRFRIVERCAYSKQFGCFCQTYDLNAVKPISEMQQVKDDKCDDLVGFNAFDWTDEITPVGQELIQFYQDTCQ